MLKRITDIGISICFLFLSFPFLALVALAVRVALGHPIFFCQVRAGLNGQPFELIKFRTMHNGPGSDAMRLTKFGRFLRASSIDELPELFNVLKGDMSLVGPRPLLMEYLPLYSPEQARRHEVRPGMTGLAQINGRNALSWKEKFEYDVEYVDHHSLVLDARILFKTLTVIVMARGINRSEDVTMVPFKGREEMQLRGKDE